MKLNREKRNLERNIPHAFPKFFFAFPFSYIFVTDITDNLRKHLGTRVSGVFRWPTSSRQRADGTDTLPEPGSGAQIEIFFEKFSPATGVTLRSSPGAGFWDVQSFTRGLAFYV